jgi:hypothetical protein
LPATPKRGQTECDILETTRPHGGGRGRGVKRVIESLSLSNGKGEMLRIYRIEGTEAFDLAIINRDGESNHFEITASEADDVVLAIRTITEGGEG